MKVARIYERVSTDEQDLTRQAGIEQGARASGYYVAASIVKRRLEHARIVLNYSG